MTFNEKVQLTHLNNAIIQEHLPKDEEKIIRDEVLERLEKPVMSASDLKEAKAEKDVRDAVAPKQEQQKKTDLEI